MLSVVQRVADAMAAELASHMIQLHHQDPCNTKIKVNTNNSQNLINFYLPIDLAKMNPTKKLQQFFRKNKQKTTFQQHENKEDFIRPCPEVVSAAEWYAPAATSRTQ